MISYDRYISITVLGSLSHLPFVVSQTFLRYANTHRKSCRKKGVAKVNDAQIW